MSKQPLPTNMVPVPEEQRKGFAFNGEFREWAAWAKEHKALGQELALRMREYGGPATQDEPPPGGTPVAMRRAA